MKIDLKKFEKLEISNDMIKGGFTLSLRNVSSANSGGTNNCHGGNCAAFCGAKPGAMIR